MKYLKLFEDINWEEDWEEDWEEEELDENLVVLDKYDGEGIRIGMYKMDITDKHKYFFKVPLHLDFIYLSNELFDNEEYKKNFLYYNPKSSTIVANSGVVYIEFHMENQSLVFSYMTDRDWEGMTKEGYGYKWYIENGCKYIGEVEDLI